MNFAALKVGNVDIIKTMNTLAVLNNGNTFGGAYGQFVDTHKGLNQIQHGGADAGYRSYIGRFPDQEFAVVVFSNYARSNAAGLALQVADLYLKDHMIAQENSEVSNTESPKFVSLSSNQLEKFSGYYWNEVGVYARRMYVKNDTLRYYRNEFSESPLAPISKNEFQMLNVGVDLKVKFKGNGKNRKMIVTVGSDDPVTSDEFTPPNYSATDLKAFNGLYYSDELSTYYTIKSGDDKLTITHPRISDFDIKAIKQDLFSGNGIVKFERNAAGNITGLRVSNGRVRNLWFKKME